MKEVVKEVKKPVYIEIEKIFKVPVCAEKVVNIDKEIYIQNIVEVPVEKIIEVEKEVSANFFLKII